MLVFGHQLNFELIILKKDVEKIVKYPLEWWKLSNIQTSGKTFLMIRNSLVTFWLLFGIISCSLVLPSISAFDVFNLLIRLVFLLLGFSLNFRRGAPAKSCPRTLVSLSSMERCVSIFYFRSSQWSSWKFSNILNSSVAESNYVDHEFWP